MADLSKLQVRAFFDEPELGKLSIGQPVTIVWDARPDEQWHGHISHLPSTIITFGTRNVGEVLVAIDDADGALLPDTNVRVTVTTANVSNVLQVPRDAMHFEQGSTFVYRKEGNSLHRVKVAIGITNLSNDPDCQRPQLRRRRGARHHQRPAAQRRRARQSHSVKGEICEEQHCWREAFFSFPP